MSFGHRCALSSLHCSIQSGPRACALVVLSASLLVGCVPEQPIADHLGASSSGEADPSGGEGGGRRRPRGSDEGGLDGGTSNSGLTAGDDALPVDTTVDPAGTSTTAMGTDTAPEETGEPPIEEQAFVENAGANCPVDTIPGAIGADANLPDPFTKIDGTRVASRAEWPCRRQEILRTAQEHVYGFKPPRPTSVTGTVSENNITVNVSENGANVSFTVTVQLPQTGSAPYPAIIDLGGGGTLDGGVVGGEGVAIISYNPFTIGAEGGGASRANKQGVFYNVYGNDSFTGLLLAWSWGVSRIIDVIEDSGTDIIKVDSLGVTGCSRLGKGAFTIGAFDQRIALTIPFESGSGGVPIWRGIPAEGAQSAPSAYGETYWLGDAFGSFINNVNTLPIDTHEIVAMVAPRGLLILDNPHIANLGPESAHVAALAGAEVYEALGARDNISYHSDVQEGAHCAWRNEWNEPLRQSIQKHLTGTGDAPGIITARPTTTGNLANFVDWETPTLQ